MDALGGFDLDSLPIATDTGHFVSENHMRIAEVLRDYDKDLEIEWIPEGRRQEGDKAFRIIHTNPRTGYRYVVCYADSLDGSLLERIIQMDAAKKGSILTDIDARNQAIKLIQQKEWEEKKAEAHDIAQHVLKSPKSKYTVRTKDGKLLTFRD